MLLKKKNLLNELRLERHKFKTEEAILNEVFSILNKNEIKRAEILSTLTEKSSTKYNTFHFDCLESDRIFHLEQIKSICVDYRLRFLDSHLFKGKIPEEAITKIHQLEK